MRSVEVEKTFTSVFILLIPVDTSFVLLNKSIALFFSIVVLTFVLSFGCAQRDGNDVRLEIAVPNSLQKARGVHGASVTSRLQHLVVNVSGPNISQPIFFVWEACNSCATQPVIELSVPRGNDRLIQILAAYGDEASNIDLYYGDVARPLQNQFENVPVNISQITGSSVETGGLAGRYMNSAGGGPTGKIWMTYQHPGRPKMVLEKRSMINGWFNIFALKGFSGFSYELEGGPILFSNLDIGTLATSSRIVRATVPVSYYSEGSTIRTRNAQKFVLGWFASDPSYITSKVACFKQYGYFGRLFASSSLTARMLYDPMNSPASNRVTVEGGYACGAVELTGEHINSLVLDPTRIDNGGGDTFSGQARFLKMLPSPYGDGQRSALLTPTPSGLQLDFEFLPGLASVFDSFVIFKYSGAAKPIEQGDGIDCNQAGAQGFAQVASQGVTVGTLNYSVAVPMSNSEYSAAQNLSFLICPKISGNFVGTGVVIQHYKNTGATLPSEVTQFSLNVPAKVTTSACTRGVVSLQGPNQPYSSISRTVTIVAPTSTNLYTSAVCSGGTTSMNLSFNAGEMLKEFFFATTTPNTGYVFVVSSSGLSGTSSTYDVGNAGTHFRLEFSPISRLGGGTCQEYEILRSDSSGFPAGGGALTINLSGVSVGSTASFNGLFLSDCKTTFNGQQNLGSSTTIPISQERTTFAVVGPPQIGSNRPKFTIYATNATLDQTTLDVGLSDTTNSLSPASIWLRPRQAVSSIATWFNTSQSLLNLTGIVPGSVEGQTVTNGVDGYDTFKFVSTGGNNRHTSGTNFSHFTTSVLLKVSTAASQKNLMGFSRTGMSTSIYRLKYDGPNQLLAFDVAGATASSANNTMPASTWKVVSIVRQVTNGTDGNIFIYINGSLAGSYAATAVANFGTNTDYFYIGDDSTTANNGLAEYAEVIVQSSAVSSSEAANICRYFQSKYPGAGVSCP